MATLKETTTSTSASVIALGGALSGFSAFASMLAVGSTVQHVEMFDNAGNWEISTFTLTDTKTLTRQFVETSSNGGQPATFASSANTVVCTVADASTIPVARFQKTKPGGPPGLVGSDGNVVALFSQESKRVIALCGDSTTYLNNSFGIAPSPSAAFPGIQANRADLTTPAGAGTLTWDATARTLTWQAPTDATPGPAVSVREGIFRLESSQAKHGLIVSVTAAYLGASGSTSVTITTASSGWRRGTGGVAWAWVMHALTGARFNLLNFGIGGEMTSDILVRFPDVVAAKPDVIHELSGTNDISGDVPAATIIANRVAMWDMALAAGIPVIAGLITARFGTELQAEYQRWTPSRMKAIMAVNAGLVREARKRNGVQIVDYFSVTVDPNKALITTASSGGTTIPGTPTSGNTWAGSVRAGYMSDGLHMASPASYEMGALFADAINSLIPAEFARVNVGGYNAYDAALNPTGNLMTTTLYNSSWDVSNQSAFHGTSGVPSSGVSLTPSWVTGTAYAKDAHVVNGGNLYRAMVAGTSGTTAPTHLTSNLSDGGVTWLFVCSGVTATFPSGWSASRFGGAGASAVVHRVTDPAGGTDWVEIVMQGATNANETFQIYPGQLDKTLITNVVDTIQMTVDVNNPEATDPRGYDKVSGFYADIVMTGANVTDTGNRAFDGPIMQGVRHSRFLLETEPYPIDPNVTAFQPRFFVSVPLGKVARLRFRNMEAHKVI